MVRPLAALAALALSVLPAAAQQAGDKWFIDRTLTVTPKAVAVPELQYRLFPLTSERKPGDAAPIYLRFAHERRDEVKKDLWDKADKWIAAPIDQLPLDEMKTWLQGYAYNLKQLDLGARRKSCDWNYTLDAGDLFGILLPDVQEMRMYAKLLAIKARYEIATGQFAEAVRTLETGFAFAQHIAEGPFLINDLVAVAAATDMANRLLELADRPNAPNLYWALTAMPRPLIDQRKAVEFEQRVGELEFPELFTADQPRTAAEWDAALAKYRASYRRVMAMLGGGEKPGERPPPEPLPEEKQIEAGRKYLVETLGTDGKKVEAMPNAQVLLLYHAALYRQYRDDPYKATYLPYAEAAPLLAAARKRLDDAPPTEAANFARALLPALGRCMYAQARLERTLAALRTVEALRLHAADHKGQLPDKLADVTAVPLPNDPVTGKPFEYKRDGDGAVLAARSPDEPMEPRGLRLSITVRKP